MQVPRAVRRQDDDRRECRGDRAELGDRHGRFGQELEQEGLELVVGPVNLVDQQDHRTWSLVLDCLQQWTGHEVLRGEQVVGIEWLSRSLGGADAQQLARIVPFVQGLGSVDPLVALQPDEGRVERGRQGLRRLGLADTGFTFEQQWLRQARRAEQCSCQALISEVVDAVEFA